MTHKLFAMLVILVAAFLTLPPTVDAGAKSKFLLLTIHTPEQCLATLDEVAKEKSKLLQQTWWACETGDHAAYAIVDAESETDALNILPAAQRSGAKAVKVSKLTVAQIKEFHKQMEEKMGEKK